MTENEGYGFTHTNSAARAEKLEHIDRAIRVNGGVHGDDARWMLNEYRRLTTEGMRAMEFTAPQMGAFWRGLYAQIGVLETALIAAREELARWGWGDHHYGDRGQEKSVTDTLAKIDQALDNAGVQE